MGFQVEVAFRILEVLAFRIFDLYHLYHCTLYSNGKSISIHGLNVQVPEIQPPTTIIPQLLHISVVQTLHSKRMGHLWTFGL